MNVLFPLQKDNTSFHGKEASCHLLTLYPFVVDQCIHQNESNSTPAASAIISGYESAFATYLAVQHLNTGDGSVIPEIATLEHCPIHFTFECLDTRYNAGLALQALIDRMLGEDVAAATTNSTHSMPPQPPCAFLGAYRSSISGPTSTITSLKGYPQISGMSTSTDLDNKFEHPLFGRTVPSDAGTATVVAQYFLHELRIRHLMVLATNDSFGNAYASQLRQALANGSDGSFRMQQIPMERDGSDMEGVVSQVKQWEYRYIFVAHFGGSNMGLNDALMTEAHRQGIVGSDSDSFVWIFSDGIAPSLASKRFQVGDALLEAYKGVGSIEASGGGIGNGNNVKQYNVFARQLLALKQSFLQHDDHPLASILPYYSDPRFDSTLSFLEADTFLNPLSDGRVPFIYEATALLGLAACKTAANANGTLYLSGERFYESITATTFEGMSGYVQLDASTGTRMANSTLFRLINFVLVDSDKTGTVQLNPVNSKLFADGQWETLQPFIYNDGTTQQPLEIPPQQLDPNHISTATRAIALIFCGISILLSLYFIYWTWYKRNTRVIRASQPVFLYLVCVGTVILASTIIPTSFDGGVAKSLNGLHIACTSSVWLLSTGVGTIFSALFAKAHRINRIMQSSRRCRRIKVSTRDTLIPIIALIFLNVLILSLMTALDPIQYEIIVVSYDSFDRMAETYGGCGYWASSLEFTISLLVLNLGMLCAASFQSWKCRNLSTEFQESLSIFRALSGILLVVFVGCPVLIIARENTDAFLFISSAIIFLSCMLILLLIFIPKLQYEKTRQSMRGGITRISGLEIHSSTIDVSSSFTVPGISGSLVEDDDTDTGERVLSDKAQNELVAEVAALKKCVRVLRANNQSLKAKVKQHNDGDANSDGDDGDYDEAAILLTANGINIRDGSDDDLSSENENANPKCLVRFSVPEVVTGNDDKEKACGKEDAANAIATNIEKAPAGSDHSTAVDDKAGGGQ